MTNVTLDVTELARQGEPVLVEMHSDDFHVQVHADARPWLAQASDKDLSELSEIDYGGDYAADEIYHFLESTGDEDARKLADYLSTGPTMAGDTVGFEVHAEGDEIKAWLQEYRPAAWAALIAHEIEREHDIEAEWLSEMVIEVAMEAATEELNALDDADAEADGDEILGRGEKTASDVNNSGVRGQMEWLLQQGVSRDDIEEAIEKAALAAEAEAEAEPSS